MTTNTRRRIGGHLLGRRSWAYGQVLVRRAFPYTRPSPFGQMPDLDRLTIVVTRRPHRYAHLFRNADAWVRAQAGVQSTSPTDDPIAALYRTCDDHTLDWLDDLMVRAGLMWFHDPNDGTCPGHMNRVGDTHCGGCNSPRCN